MKKKLIICEGETDLIFLAEVLKSKDWDLVKEYSTNNLPTIELEKRDEKIKITCVKGIANIKNFLGTMIKFLIEKGEISMKDIAIVVDEEDFRNLDEKAKNELKSYNLYFIKPNLEGYLAKKIKGMKKFEGIIRFWEDWWKCKMENVESQDIKEFLYFLHGLILKEVPPKNRCLKETVKRLCQELGKTELEKCFSEIFEDYFFLRQS